jgi:hypothetical protein
VTYHPHVSDGVPRHARYGSQNFPVAYSNILQSCNNVGTYTLQYILAVEFSLLSQNTSLSPPFRDAGHSFHFYRLYPLIGSVSQHLVDGTNT